MKGVSQRDYDEVYTLLLGNRFLFIPDVGANSCWNRYTVQHHIPHWCKGKDRVQSRPSWVKGGPERILGFDNHRKINTETVYYDMEVLVKRTPVLSGKGLLIWKLKVYWILVRVYCRTTALLFSQGEQGGGGGGHVFINWNFAKLQNQYQLLSLNKYRRLIIDWTFMKSWI